MTELFTVENLVALATLTGLEIVLGIDNIVFIAILVGKLPKDSQGRARRIGLFLAMFTRIALLLFLGWIMGLTADLFSIPKFWTLEMDQRLGISGRDLILLVGGLFLIGKATYEIHDKLEGKHEASGEARFASFPVVIVQVVLIDIVFSLDSVITAVGMVKVDPEAQWIGLSIMIAAVIIAVGVMLVFAGMIAGFVERHPTMKMLALSFLILIGVTLVVEGLHAHIPKGYVYFAMAFSLAVEMINMRLRKLTSPVTLQQSYVDAPPGSVEPTVSEQVG
jgi:predicted tellurium resistance membrane protein TerC